MDEKNTAPVPENPAAQGAAESAAENAAKPEVKPEAKPKPAEPEYFTLKAKPPKKKAKADVEAAKKIANRYLGIQALEKIVNAKKVKKKQREMELRFKPPESPEEFYDRGQKYVNGAECAVPFQERALYYQKAADMFAGAGDYNDAAELALKYSNLAQAVEQEGYESAYAQAMERKKRAQSSDDWFEAARAFERISGYRDASAQEAECQGVLDRRTNLKKPLLLLRVAVIIGLIVGFVLFFRTDRFQYNLARFAHRVGLDNVAAAFLDTKGDYRDTESLLEEIYYDEGVERMEKGEYKKALTALKKCTAEHSDLQERLDECNYYLGEKAFAGNHNKTAKDYFKACSEGYKDREARIDECNYLQGKDSLAEGDLKEAVSHFVSANGFADSNDLRLAPELELLREAQPGEHRFFGGSEYRILDRQGKHFTLLRKNLIHELPFHQDGGNVDWAHSSLRATLNGQEWLAQEFTPEELALIQPDESGDLVSLLSAADFQRYEEVMGDKNALWWLKDQGSAKNRIQFVSDEGHVMADGYDTDTLFIYVRPVIQVELD